MDAWVCESRGGLDPPVDEIQEVLFDLYKASEIPDAFIVTKGTSLHREDQRNFWTTVFKSVSEIREKEGDKPISAIRMQSLVAWAMQPGASANEKRDASDPKAKTKTPKPKPAGDSSAEEEVHSDDSEADTSRGAKKDLLDQGADNVELLVSCLGRIN